MSLLQLRKDIKELKNLIITQYEPQFKIFVFQVNGLTDTGETEEEVDTFITTHPPTHVLKLFRRSCRKAL